ncbi:UNVERIFIED_ORG: hypothetical protein J2X79_001098 [Arthrobacter globiformis]|nr:hypothetical protein [Arthrobacter globiformis]
MRSQVEAASARSWVRVLASSGPCCGGAVPDPGRLVRGQIGREPGHPVPVRDVLHPPVRRRPGVAGLDADRVVPLPPGTHLRSEPARDKLPSRNAAGRLRRGRVQEVRLQRRRPGRIESRGLVDHDPGVLPRQGPCLQRGQRQRPARGQFQGVDQQCTRGAFADGQDTRDLRCHSHLPDGAIPRGLGRRRHGLLSVGIPGDELHLHSRKPGLDFGQLGQSVQVRVSLAPQRINTCTVRGQIARQGPVTRRAANKNSQRRDRGVDGLHRLHS